MRGGKQARELGEFLLSLVVSLLPTFYRRRWFPGPAPDLRRAALITGIVELLLCVGLLIWGYLRWIDYIGTQFARAYMSNSVEGLNQTTYRVGVGMTAFFSYFLRPSTVVLAYFAIEGVVRGTAALVTGEIVGTLPLALAAGAQQRLERRKAEKWMGPRIADLVHRHEGDGYDLKIASCRPKDWGSLVTLSYEGELYVLGEQEEGPPPRRFVYLLKKLPAGTVARGLRAYDPKEVVEADT